MQQAISSVLFAKAQRFVDVFHMLNRGFVWDHGLVKQFGALTYVQQRESGVPDIEQIQEMRRYIKDNTDIFSSFRGMNELMTALLVYLNPKKEAFFDESKEVFKTLKQAGFSAGYYLPLTAIAVAESIKGELSLLDFQVGRMQQFYKGFKSHHFWLTSQDDYVYAALLASTPLPVDDAIREIEQFYIELAENGIYKGNGLQSLTHVLCLGEQDHRQKLEKTLRCHRHLIAKGYKLNHYHLAFLGVLSLVSDAPEVLIDEAIDLEQWLKVQKGFGGLSVDKKTRFVMAASICIQNYIASGKVEHRAILANSIQAIMIAEQIAITAAIIASSAAAASSSS